LLSHGLDPNEPTEHGQTFWTEFLDDVCTGASPKVVRSIVVLTLLQIFTLFLRYGADPAAFYYSISDGDFGLYPKGISRAKSRSLCLIISEYEDEVNGFIEVIEQEKAYHKSRGLSGIKKASHPKPLKPKPTFPEKRKMAVRPVKSRF